MTENNDMILMSVCVVPTNPIYNTDNGEDDVLFVKMLQILNNFFEKQLFDVEIKQGYQVNDVSLQGYCCEGSMVLLLTLMKKMKMEEQHYI